MPMIDENEVLRRARQLAQIQPDPRATRHAVHRVNEMLDARQQGAQRRRTLRKMVLPSSLAATVLIVLGAGLLSMVLRSASAADLLKEAAQANGAYRGWVHITLESVNLSGAQPANSIPKSGAIHLNTTDGTIACLMEMDGQRMVFFFSPARGEQAQYDSGTKELHVGSLSPLTAGAMAAYVPKWTTPAGLLEMVSDAGKKAYEMKHTQDGALERFDIVARQPASGEALGLIGAQRVTLWVDPASKLLQKAEGVSKGITATYRYAYGPPEFKDVYDLDVPRDAQVVDSRAVGSQPASSVGPLAVASAGPQTKAIPPGAKVVDNRPGEQVKRILDAINARLDANFGDHVALLTTATPLPDGKVDNNRGLVRLFAVNGKNWLTFTYRVGDPAAAANAGATLAATVPAGWPRPDAETLLPILKDALPAQFFVCDTKHAFSGILQDHAYIGGEKELPKLELIPWKDEQGLAGAIWPGRVSQWLYGPDVKTEAFTPQGGPEGQVGLRTAVLTRSQAGPSSPEVRRRNETVLLLDERRGFVPMEKTTRQFGQDNKTVESQTLTRYLDFAQLPDGQWYPTRWQETRDTRHNEGGNGGNVATVRDVREYNLRICPGMKLTPEWFANPAQKRLAKP